MKRIARTLLSLVALAVAAKACSPLAFVDRYQGNLASGYTSGATTASVTSAAGLPSGATCFFALVKPEGANTEEIVLVTNVSGTTLTLAGAKAGTSASNHAIGAQVIASVMPAAAFTQFQADTRLVPPSGTATTYYISTAGSDSNACSSGSKCLTLAHVLAIIPAMLDHPYTINVADGTYAEPMLFTGYTGALLSVVGNVTTPGNVVFSGTVSCPATDGVSYTADACMIGTWVSVSGITLSGAGSRGLFAMGHAYIELNKLVVSGAITLAGVEIAIGSTLEMLGDVTVTQAPAGQYGMIIHQHSVAQMYNDAVLSITGSGPGSATIGIWIRAGSTFSIHTGSSTTIQISEVYEGIYLTQSTFDSTTSAATITITNSSVGASGPGLFASQLSSWFGSSGALTVTKFGTCISADLGSVVAQHSYTNSGCSTSTNAVQQAQIIPF